MVLSYILDENNQPVPAPDGISAWKWRGEHMDRVIVAKTEVYDSVRVSTVFLTLDHAYTVEEHVPILWETMIFGGPHGDYQRRYETYEEAVKGHEEAVALARSAPPQTEVNYEFTEENADESGPNITWN